MRGSWPAARPGTAAPARPASVSDHSCPPPRYSQIAPHRTARGRAMTAAGTSMGGHVRIGHIARDDIPASGRASTSRARTTPRPPRPDYRSAAGEQKPRRLAVRGLEGRSFRKRAAGVQTQPIRAPDGFPTRESPASALAPRQSMSPGAFPLESLASTSAIHWAVRALEAELGRRALDEVEVPPHVVSNTRCCRWSCRPRRSRFRFPTTCAAAPPIEITSSSGSGRRRHRLARGKFAAPLDLVPQAVEDLSG